MKTSLLDRVVTAFALLILLAIGGHWVVSAQDQPPGIPPMPQLTTNDLWISLGQCKVNGETQATYINQLRSEIVKLQAELAALKAPPKTTQGLK